MSAAARMKPLTLRPLTRGERALACEMFGEALDAALSGDLQDVLTVAMLLKVSHMAREGHLAPVLARAILG